MPDSKRRQHIEILLKEQLKKAEKAFASDPKMEKMIHKLRDLYLHDKEDFMSALGPSPTPQKGAPAKLPNSKIPHLLLLLDELAKKTPRLRPIAPLNSKTASLPPSSVSTPSTAEPQMTSSQIRRQIERITVEINKNREIYESLKKDESLIMEQKGKYGIPHERIRCQRLLREIPGKMTYLSTLRQQLEEQLQIILSKK